MVRAIKKFIILLTFLFIYLSRASSPCQGFNQVDQIQSGTVTFNNLNKTQYCQQISINYQIDQSGFQVVSSLQSFKSYGNFNNGVDYSIHSSPKKNSNYFTITLIINSFCNWSTISANYLATSRSQIIMGRFVTDIQQSLGCCSQINNGIQSKSTLSSINPKINSQWNVIKIVAFITGIKVRQSNLSQIAINQTQINLTTGVISVDLIYSQYLQIEIIQISYILILKTFPFALNDFNSDYQFSMSQQVQNNNFINTDLTISTKKLGCNFSKCPSSCIDNSTCLSLSGYSYQNNCLLCQQDQTWNGTMCVTKCQNNKVWNGSSCICKSGAILQNDQCIQCPLNSSPDSYLSKCVCNLNYIWNNYTNSCNYYVCPQNSQPIVTDKGTNCQCKNGYYNSSTSCVAIPSCPNGSIFNIQSQTCRCTQPNTYLINNLCSKCQPFSNWNGYQCVCQNGYTSSSIGCVSMCLQSETWINGKCISKNLNGSDIICNQGYYNAAGKCLQCHISCGTCSGSNYNNCLTCADVTYTLKNNICARLGQCPQGLYLNNINSSCTPCSTYCSSCTCDNDCSQCITGFNVQSLTYGGIKVSYCVEICGDGKRFQLQCDDGNTLNGDGCDSNCKVQVGWSCSGGSSIQASTCTSLIPNISTISLTGKVLLLGKIIQGVRVSYLPPALTQNDCPQCYKLLWVRVIKSDIVPAVSVQYLPKSQYQFLVQFDFHGTFSIPLFTISVQINPQFAKYFNSNDLAQIKISTIDPSVLALNDQSTTLGIKDIYTNSSQITLSNALVQQIFN